MKQRAHGEAMREGERMIRVFAAIALVLGLLLGPSAGWAADKLKIGFISSFSTPTSTVGPDVYDGFTLALQESGGKLGGREVELVKGDDQFKPDVAVQLARKMLDEDKVQLITGIVPSNNMIAVAHTVLPRKVFILSTNSGPSQLAGAECNPYFFAASFQNDTTPEAMGLYLSKQGVKNVYLMGANYAAGKDMLAGFKRGFKGKIVGEVYTPLPQFDFAAELAEIRAAKPDAVFFFYNAGAASINFVKQFAEAGLKGKIPLYATNFSLDERTLPAMGDAALSVELSTFWSADLDNAANKAFVKHFVEQYKRRPTLFSADGYDSARLLDAALKVVDGQIERKDDFRKAMETVKFDSVRGNFAFSANHFPIETFYLAEVKRDAAGNLYNALKGTIVKDLADPYVGECKMK
jgi:branched-chain amino acid transport system substrate-binding protein